MTKCSSYPQPSFSSTVAGYSGRQQTRKATTAWYEFKKKNWQRYAVYKVYFRAPHALKCSAPQPCIILLCHLQHYEHVAVSCELWSHATGKYSHLFNTRTFISFFTCCLSKEGDRYANTWILASILNWPCSDCELCWWHPKTIISMDRGIPRDLPQRT